MSLVIQNAPGNNSVIFDADDRILNIISTNGEGYYFTATIITDNNEVLRVLSLSKKTATTAQLNLSGLYRHFFNHAPIYNSATGFLFVPHLAKKMRVLIKEFSIDTGNVSQLRTTHTFNVWRSFKKNKSSVTSALLPYIELAESLPDNCWIFPDSIVKIPFFLKNLSNTGSKNMIEATVRKDNSTVIYTDTLIVTENGHYYFNIRLDELDLSTAEKVNITIKLLGKNSSISRSYNLRHIDLYSRNTILFQNNYGMWQPFFLYGQKSTPPNYFREEYELEDFQFQSYQVDVERKTIINTGHLYHYQYPALDLICRSLEIYLVDASRQLQKVRLRTNKLGGLVDNEGFYNENLEFSAKE